MRIDGSIAFQNQNQYQNTSQTAECGTKIEDNNVDVENISNKPNNFPGEHQLIEAIEKSNKDLKLDGTSLQFSIHEKTKQIMVKIVNDQTKEVIKEIPSEKVLDMVASMMERTGLFLDKKA